MGNALISGVLFQPPSPPSPLHIDNARGTNNCEGSTTTTSMLTNKTKKHNISVKYLWLYSQDGNGNSTAARLIPAIHITHNDTTNNRSSSSMPAPQTHKYTLLYSHGNAEDIGLLGSFLIDLARLLQINVLCYDYSGYGVSIERDAVGDFYEGVGAELEGWLAWRRRRRRRREMVGGERMDGLQQQQGDGVISFVNDKGYTCQYSQELFVAPIVTQEHKDNTNSDNLNDFATYLTNKKQERDHQASSYDFSSVCGNEYNSTIPNLAQWAPPSPSEQHCYANIQSAYDYLTTIQGVLPSHVILYGKSVGSGPTCWLAQRLCQSSSSSSSSTNHCSKNGSTNNSANNPASSNDLCNIESREPYQAIQREGTTAGTDNSTGGTTASVSSIVSSKQQQPGGVVLHSPFLSVIRVVLNLGFTTLGDLFPNVDRVGDFTCPVYVIHGSDDEIVPFYHGQKLFQSLPNSSKTVPFWARGAGHNNIENDMPTAYIKRLQQFFRQCDRSNYPKVGSKGGGSGGASQRTMMQYNRMMQSGILNQNVGNFTTTVVANNKNGYTAPPPIPTTTTRPPIARYASQDSYHGSATSKNNNNMMMMTPTQTKMASKPSKQRKQKGTLVMRSYHNNNDQTLASQQQQQQQMTMSRTVHQQSPPLVQHQYPAMLTVQHHQHQNQQHIQQRPWVMVPPLQHLQQHQAHNNAAGLNNNYTKNNRNVQYHRSMSDSASMICNTNEHHRHLSPHHSPHGHLQKNQQQQQAYYQGHTWQQPQLQQRLDAHSYGGLNMNNNGMVQQKKYRE